MLHPIHYARKLRKNATPAEKLMWKQVRRDALEGYKIDRQFPFIYGKNKKGIYEFFIFDFYCHAAKLAIELDGEVHEQQSTYDKWRDETVASHGILTHRIKNQDFMNDVHGTLNQIAKIIRERAASLKASSV